MAGETQFSDTEDIKTPENFIRTKISDDAYSATVTILKHNPDAVFGIDTIKQFLDRNNITYGLKDERIQEIINSVKSGPAGKKVIVAEGAAFEESKDGIEDYRFSKKLDAGKIDGDKIDFKERGLVNNVRAGEVLAVITKEVPGKPGMCVDGKVIEPQPVKKIKFPTAGINVSMFTKDNTFTYTAMASGHARLVFNNMQVNEDFIIVGDLDYTKGNIDFVGNVEVKGTIKSGFKVKAGGDVLIGGNIEPGAFVQAGKDIAVKGTVKCGKKPGKIIAGRDINAITVLNSLLEAGGDVYIKKQILESTVHCDGKFASSTAKIVGCRITAISGIFVNTVGLEDSNVENYLNAGKNIELAERFEKVKSELEKIKNEKALLAKNVSKNVGYKDEDFTKLDINEQDRVKRMGAARSKHMKMLKEQEEELLKEKEELMPNMKENPNATIEIKGCIYPACFIRVGKKEIKILDEKKRACVINGFS